VDTARILDSVGIGDGSVEEIGNRFESGGRSGSPSSYRALVFELPLKGSGRDDPLSEPVDQLLMSVTLDKVELLGSVVNR
jgi:hypothetical protein